ncbi:MAG: glycosyltransferase [Kiritimatiellae bacterium]|nr:glycosyltransferase [Kiritimatiellia bacterium]
MAADSSGKRAARRRRIAFLYRYGVHDHAELYPIIPLLLKKLGESHDVLYVGPNRHLCAERYRYPGVRYMFVPFRVNRSRSRDKVFKALLWYFYLPFLSLYCRFWRADLIWIEESSLPAQGRLVQIFSGRSVALTVTDFFLDIYGEDYPVLRVLARALDPVDRKSWRRARGIFTRTDTLGRYVVSQGADAANVVTTRDAVLPDLFAPVEASALRAQLGFKPEDVVLVHHGILHPNKAIPLAVEWMAPLMREDPRLKLLLVGGGPDYAKVEALVREKGLGPQVVMTGWLAGHDAVNRHLNAADVGLVMRAGRATDHFHVTGALIHCMMCELPVLAVRLDGIREVVTEGEEGFFFEPGSRDEFVEKLSRLKADRALRKEMGRKGRAKALVEFDPQRITEKTVEALARFAGPRA